MKVKVNIEGLDRLKQLLDEHNQITKQLEDNIFQIRNEYALIKQKLAGEDEKETTGV